MPTNEPSTVKNEVAKAKVEELPPRYRAAIHSILKEAEKKDVGYRHFWIRRTATGFNEQQKAWAGLSPLEDLERIKRIGLGTLTRGPNGRVYWQDCELWTIPIEMANRIRDLRNSKLEGASAAKRDETAAEFADIQGRTKALVRPFVKEETKETVTA